MNRIQLLTAAVLVAVGAAGCTKTPPEAPAPKVGSASTTLTAQSSAPPAPADRDTPPADTPATHSGQPQPEAPPAPTARDTAAQQPMDDLSKAKEGSSLPLPGQVNNHSTTATDKPNKTTPQDETPAPKQ